MVVLLLITFMAWSLNIPWLFLGLIILFIITSGSIAISAVTIIGVGLLYFLDLTSYWFILMFILMGLVLLLEGRKKKGGSEEYYSPELMQLLGGGGG
jgi:predicted membrane protein